MKLIGSFLYLKEDLLYNGSLYRLIAQLFAEPYNKDLQKPPGMKIL